MTRSAVLFAVLSALAALPAGAQTAISTAGDVGSAVLRGGYPAAGGAIALPTLGISTAIATSGTANAGTATSSGTASSAGTSGGRGGAGVASGAAQTAGAGSGSNWLLCEPSGASGLAPLFTGTDLSCAPH